METVIADVLGEIALVLVVSSLLGAVAWRFGQPRVVGQILAGIILGPTLLGQLPGHWTSRLFSAAALPAVSVLANVAVVIFMFVVGYELDLRPLRGYRRAVPMIAGASLLIPMGLGIGTLLVLRSGFTSLGAPHHLTPSFILFMGVVMSITAFPVLATIVRERGIAGTRAGLTATAAAGIMDALAWLALAAAIADASHPAERPLAETAGLFAAFAVAMLLIVRPILRWWMAQRRAVLSNQLLLALALALGSAWVTATLGLQPVFGGFLAGLTMPTIGGTPDADVLRPLEAAARLLLPLFFVVTGLSLTIDSLGGEAFALLAVICAVATLGKTAPAYACSRLAGLAPRDSAAIAALINTRGLTELIALNAGLNAGIIGRPLFSVLVLMALVTTLATAPLLTLIRLPVADGPSLSRQPTALSVPKG